MIELDKVLNVGGFNLDRALEIDPKFMEPEYPFEWAGSFELPHGQHELVLHEGPDPSMDLVLLPLRNTSREGIEAVELEASLLFSDSVQSVGADGHLAPGSQRYRLELAGDQTHFTVDVEQAGAYGLFSQHLPSEFSLELRRGETLAEPVASHEYKPNHEHADEVTSVGISLPGDLDYKRLNEWIGTLLRTQGQDIFRMKGVLSVKGEEARFVFQGVHMLFEGRPDKPWGKETRHNSLIFIGRNLDRAKLNEDFRKCLA
ncbi:putative GTP-binding protein YjiA [compost metagenome]